MTYDHKIGSIIRSHRESRGYSQDYVATMLGICQSAYANIESGRVKLKFERLMQIAEVLNIDVHQLISNDAKINGHIPTETKQAYDILIAELKNEITFLRTLVQNK